MKAADGTDAWPQWTKAAKTLRDAGLQAVPWSYDYGDPREIDVLLETGETTIALDPEAHFEQAPEATRSAFVERLRAVNEAGVRVWSAVEARPDLHGAIPYVDLAAISDVMIPMVAWQVWEPRSCAHWLDFWDANCWRTRPWLSAESVTPAELADSVALGLGRYGGASVWAAHVLSAAQVNALAAMAASSRGAK